MRPFGAEIATLPTARYRIVELRVVLVCDCGIVFFSAAFLEPLCITIHYTPCVVSASLPPGFSARGGYACDHF